MSEIEVKDSAQIIKELGTSFHLKEFQEEWMEAKYPEIEDSQIKFIVQAVENKISTDFKQASDDLDKEMLLIKADQFLDDLLHSNWEGNYSIAIPTRPRQQFEMICKLLYNRIYSILENEGGIQTPKDSTHLIKPNLKFNEWVILAYYMQKHGAFSKTATKDRIAESISSVTGFSQKHIQNGLTPKEFETINIPEYNRPLKRFLQQVMDDIN